MDATFRRLEFSDLRGWADDDHVAALSAFRRSAFRFLEKPYRSGSLGVPSEALAIPFAAARDLTEPVDPQTARRFFETQFVPVEIVPADGKGFVTGFYEPEAAASPVRTETFRYPVFARPADLVDIDDTNRPDGFDPYFAFARNTPAGLAIQPDRGEIERGALAGRGLEIAWLADKVDLFFIHVQGAARLKMPDGSLRRITYAAKTGHRFTGIGRILLDRGEIDPAVISMQAIRAWLAGHPDQVDELLWQNRSFIFFREAAVDDPALGPIAAAKVPLAPGRSMAVDRLLHTFGTPFFVTAPGLTSFGGSDFRRLMIAQDTGSAIVGPARGDLFAGSGHAAGEAAGVVRHDARFVMLVPTAIAGRFA